MNQFYIKREIEKEFKRIKNLFPVVIITGPRQSGKTTLCRNVFPDYNYINLERISIREQIMESPEAFLIENKAGVIIDEAQRAPDLFSYLQVVVDEYPESHFILTGSSNFMLMEKVTQTLAGRAGTLTLLPLSFSEISDYESSTDELLLKGGYPAVWSKQIPVKDVSQNYYTTYIERDVRQLLNVKDIIKFQTFIRLCAGRVGTVFNASALSNEVGVSGVTIQEWLSVLEASYVLFRLPPFYRNIGKRLIKSSKIYFCDTGLACYMLGIEDVKQLEIHPLRGAIFENYVVLEFLKNRFNNGNRSNLTFYRDKSQREVDLIQENGNDIFAYEIKSAKSFHENFVKNLNYIKEFLGATLKSAQVIYDGDFEIKSPDNGTVNFRNIDFS